jgi:hypothetical protein
VPDNVAVCASVFVQADQVQGLVMFGRSKTPAFPSVRYNVATGALISQSADSGQSLLGHGIQAAGGGWYRVWWSWNSATGGGTVSPTIGLVTTAGGNYSGAINDGLLLWGVQLEYGAAPTDYVAGPTLLAGDFLGAGGQLFEVAADTQLAGGVGTVPVINRVRATIASGSAVTWYRPTCEMVLPAMQAGPVYRPGAIDSTALDLVEVW